MQIDNPECGFTYKFEGPLIALNPEKGISAAERLKDILQPELEGMRLKIQTNLMQKKFQHHYF